jgi:hypothetical protein
MHNKAEEFDPTANLRALVLKTNLENPDERDVAALRKLLRDNPRLWKQAGDPARKALSIRLLNSPLSIAAKEASKVAIPDLLAHFNYDESPPLEKLLIDQIVIRWLHLAIVDYEFSLEAHWPKQPDERMLWEKRLSLAQRRFTQACESLIRVRNATMLIPGGLFQPVPEQDLAGTSTPDEPALLTAPPPPLRTTGASISRRIPRSDDLRHLLSRISWWLAVASAQALSISLC